MSPEALKQYVDSHPQTLFRIKLVRSLGIMRYRSTEPEKITDPRNGQVVTFSKPVTKQIELDDLVVSVVDVGRKVVSVVLQKPHYNVSSKNWEYIVYDNIASIEAVKL